MQPHEQTIVPLTPAGRAIRDATHIRSTWLRASIDTVRERGMYERYLAALPRAHHDAIRSLVAGTWHPVALAMAHYAACDALEMSAHDRREVAKVVAKHTHGQFLTLTSQMAFEAGVTPWAVLGQFHRLWERVWIGGAVGVVKTGPKDARVEIAGFPCARFAYCRMAMNGVIGGLCEPFCVKAYVKEREAQRSPTALVYAVSWA